MRLYVDGQQVSSSVTTTAQAYSGSWRLGGDSLAAWPVTSSLQNYLQGRLDEVAIWGRVLSAGEIKQLWRRGATRLKMQLRACTSPSCADNPAWMGPDGTAASTFSERHNNASPATADGTVLTTAPILPFTAFAPPLTLPANPYLQVRTIMESDDDRALCLYGGVASSCSPELLRLQLDPSTYPTEAILTRRNGPVLQQVTGLDVVYGPSGCPGGVRLNLSNDLGVH